MTLAGSNARLSPMYFGRPVLVGGVGRVIGSSPSVVGSSPSVVGGPQCLGWGAWVSPSVVLSRAWVSPCACLRDSGYFGCSVCVLGCLCASVPCVKILLIQRNPVVCRKK